MKILTSRSSDNNIGGGELSMFDHAKAMTALGHDVVVVSNLDRIKQLTSESDIEFRRGLWAYRDLGPLRIVYFALVWPLMWLHYLYLVLKEKPDVIYPHSRDDQVIFTLLKPFHRRAVVWRDPADLRYFLLNKNEDPLAKFYRWLLIQAMARADRIVTLTEIEQKIIIDHSHGVADKSKVEHKPSNILFENYTLGHKPPAKTDRIVIGTIIRLVEDKGVQFLVQAFVRLANKYDNIELWVVGDGDYRDELEHLAAGHNRVRFWGHQDNQSEFYSRFDIFVQPAVYEGWGRTIKEAMYFSIPIIGSDVGGIAKQIDHGKTGVLFEPENVKQLEKHLVKLIDDEKLRKSLGAAGYNKATSDGDFVDMFRDYMIPLFEEVS